MKTEKKRTLKGSILFTVVSVLALMVIFMTSALALASAANKRAHKTYAASQASYTARAAIESVLAAVATDNEFAKAIDDLPAKGGKFEVEVGINSPSLGRIDTVTVESMGNTDIFDPKTMTWVKRPLIRITAEVTMGGETKKVMSTIIQDPPGGGGGGGGPAFLTMGGTDSGNNGAILGGTYIGMGHGKEGGTWNNNLKYIEWNHEDLDHLTTLEDKMYLTNEDFMYKDMNAAQAPMVVNGNFDLETHMTIYYTQLGDGLQIWGDLYMKNGGLTINMTDQLQSIINSRPLSFKEAPYLYVDGQMRMANMDFAIGNGAYPINIFCGSIDLNAGSLNSSADIYCYDADKTTKIATNSTSLYTWSASLIDGGSGYSSNGGNFYSKGNLEFSGNSTVAIGGDVRVEGDVILNKEVTINGDLVVGGKMSLLNNNIKVKGKIYADTYDKTNIVEPDGGGLKDGYSEEDISFIIGKGVKHRVSDPDDPENSFEEYSDYIWLKPEVLDAYEGYTKIGDNAYDFGGAVVVDEYQLYSIGRWDEAFTGLEPPADWGTPGGPGYIENPDDPENPMIEVYTPDLNQTLFYRHIFVDPEGNEVTEADAQKPLIPTYNGKEIYPIKQYYTDTGANSIFPNHAEKATILGLSGPVKGTEGHFGKETPSAVNNRIYNGTSQLVGAVTESCTLTGTFTNPVTVNANGEDIYILIKDAVFTNEADPSEARIYVNESNGGKVYFTFQGEIECGYKKPEDDESQVLSTILDVMNEWKIEDNIQSPPGEITNVVTSANATGGQITIDGEDAKLTGSFDGVTINIVPPLGGEIWVQLDNIYTQNNAMILIKDVGADGKMIPGKVNFYVTGTNNQMNNGKIVTQSFLDWYNSGKTSQIITEDKDYIIVKDPTGVPYDYMTPPNVYLYSIAGAKLTANNDFFITAYIRAPRMNFDVPTFTSAYDSAFSRIYYNGILMDQMTNKGNKLKRLGIIGCLNVKECKSANDWVMLYIPEDLEGIDLSKSASRDHVYAQTGYIDY